MTIRKNVAVVQNVWNNAQRVDQADMRVEQAYNNQINAATIQNHIGSGVLLDKPRQRVLFDTDNLNATQASLLAAGNFDGTGLEAHLQPSDTNLGNQIEVELTDSTVYGRLTSRVALIGLDFEGNLQYDTFYFHKNEKQVTRRHYTRILSVFFNDFFGNNLCSRVLGGRFVIRETKPFQLSRDPVMVAQDRFPDLWWRDFKMTTLNSQLFNVIQTAIGAEYDADNLNINVTGEDNRILVAGDVVTQFGQKFQATTDNIQKVTLLLGIGRDDSAAVEDRYDWSGDIVISIYSLQTTVSCPSAIVPNLAIDYDPDYQPLAQLSFSQVEMFDLGYVLTDAMQPVDFIFRGTKLDSGTTSGITVGNYYVVTIKRSGAAGTGSVLVGMGSDDDTDTRFTVYSGVWVDVSESDLFFKIFTDAIKISSGAGYDSGNGMEYLKTATDTATGATVDNQINAKPFVDTGEGVLNTGILAAVETESLKLQDERTGNPVFARQEFEPSFSFVDAADLTDLQAVSEPLIIGAIKDINPKLNDELVKFQDVVGLARGDTFCIINPDPDLLSLNLVNSIITPNILSSLSYRIIGVSLCSDGYADVGANGTIGQEDIALASALIGKSISDPATMAEIRDGYVNTLDIIRANVTASGTISAADVDLITQFVNRQINSFPAGTSFTHMCLKLEPVLRRQDGYFTCSQGIFVDGYSGGQVLDPSTLGSDWERWYDGYFGEVELLVDPVFSTIPFPGVTYKITPQPTWEDYNLIESSDARLVECAFSYNAANVVESCTAATTFSCEDRGNPTITCDPGRNDTFIPGNLILAGQIINQDGYNYKLDYEVGTIILNIPHDPLTEVSLNVFNKLVADAGSGYTSASYPAFRYSDCSTVQPGDLALGRVRFSIGIMSFVPELDGVDGYSDGYLDGYGIICDQLLGLIFNENNDGILTLTAKDMYVDTVYRSLITKIQITVYLKKAGWNTGNFTEVLPDQLAGLLAP